MSSSQHWEDLYAAGAHHSVWPWSDLVSLVMRHAQPHRQMTPPQVLEVGCGVGANVPFVTWFGGVFHGVDASPTALAAIDERFPGKARLAQADFCQDLPFSGPFDIVIDRAALTHNRTEAIANGLRLIRDRMAVGGLYVGTHWFSTACDDFGKGEPTDDRYVRTGYNDGPFAGVGAVHFSDRAHLEDLFAEFEIVALEHVTVQTSLPTEGCHGYWNIVARLR